MPKFKITVDTGFSGCEHVDEVVYDDAQWQTLTEEERQKALIDAIRETINNFISAWWEEMPDTIEVEENGL